MASFSTDLRRAAAEGTNLSTFVEDHFGTRNKLVVRAVIAYLSKTHATLDLENLALVAAAGPFFSPEVLANTIGKLPITSHSLNMQPVDIDAARDHFRAVFADVEGSYPQELRSRLVLSLVADGTTRTLDLSPAASLPEPAKRAALAKLEQKIRRGDRDDVLSVVESDLLDKDLFGTAVDRVKKRGPLDRESPWYKVWQRLGAAAPSDAAPAAVFAVVNHLDPRDQLELARRGDASELVLIALAFHGDAEVRAAVAQNPSTTAEILGHLANDEELGVRALALQHPASPPAVRHSVLLRDPVLVDQVPFRARPDVSEDRLRAMAHSADEQLRADAASHASTPHDALMDLVTDASLTVQFELLRNSGLSAEVLTAFAQHVPARLRPALAEHPGCDAALLTVLAADEDPRVAARAARHPNADDGTFQAALANGVDDDGTLRAIAASTQASAATLGEVARRTSNPLVLRELASSTGTPPSLLEDLAAQPDLDVRRTVAFHPSVLDGSATLSSDFWDDLLPDLQPEEVYKIAAARSDDPSWPCVPNRALQPLSDTAEALARGAVLPPRSGLRSWEQLPSMLDAPFDLAIDPASIEGHPIGGLHGTVARSGRELDDLHRRMGNCLDTYIPQARKGGIVIASYEDAARGEVYAVGWRLQPDGTYLLFHANSLNNKGQLPEGFEQEASELARHFQPRRAALDIQRAGRRPGARRVAITGTEPQHAAQQRDQGVDPELDQTRAGLHADHTRQGRAPQGQPLRRANRRPANGPPHGQIF